MFALLTSMDRVSGTLGNAMPNWLVSLIVRIGVFSIFWFAAQAKIDGWTVFGQHFKFWNINSTTFTLFTYEYTLPLIAPDVAAYVVTFAEFFLSLFVLFGFLTRFSTMGFLIMTAIVQVFVYPMAWPTHIMWAGLLMYLLKAGAGRVSVDAFLKKPEKKKELAELH